uniref:Uncharacterized protein n=1 Tax=Strongyloides papillosus TaxID=174720 RepID=A0A0N5BHB0_STREA
ELRKDYRANSAKFLPIILGSLGEIPMETCLEIRQGLESMRIKTTKNEVDKLLGETNKTIIQHSYTILVNSLENLPFPLPTSYLNLKIFNPNINNNIWLSFFVTTSLN